MSMNEPNLSNLYIKKVIFTLIEDYKIGLDINYKNLFNYFNRYNMIQLTELEKNKILNQEYNNLEHKYIYYKTDKFIYIPPEKIEIKNKFIDSNNWCSNDYSDNCNWFLLINPDWEYINDNDELLELGLTLDCLYRKINNNYFLEYNSKCNYKKQYFTIARIISKTFENNIKI